MTTYHVTETNCETTEVLGSFDDLSQARERALAGAVDYYCPAFKDPQEDWRDSVEHLFALGEEWDAGATQFGYPDLMQPTFEVTQNPEVLGL